MAKKRAIVIGSAASALGASSSGSTGGSTSAAKVLPNPYVIVDFLFDRGLLLICVKNTSTVPAFDIHVTFSHKLMGAEGTVNISALPLFTALSFLPPGKEIATIVDTSATFFLSGQPTVFATQITYLDFANVPYSHSITHNLEIYRNIGYAQRVACDGRLKEDAQ